MKMRLTSLAAVFLTLYGFRALASVLYVDINSTNPAPPFADLSTAAFSIQDAVDAATNGDLILVNDGVYQSGFRAIKTGFPGVGQTETNRLVIGKSLTVQSLDGPTAAFINGSGIYRCVYLTNGAALNGFTLENGAAGYTYLVFGGLHETESANGGGVCGGTLFGGNVSNCVLSANTATSEGGGAFRVTLVNCQVTGNFANIGGGAADCTLWNCEVTGNSTPTTGINGPGGLPTPHTGGGIYLGSAVNCLIAGNTAWEGGGCGGGRLVNCTIVNNSAGFYGGISSATDCSVNNSILYFNSAGTNANSGGGSIPFDHCCTLPIPAGGSGNITNDPAFVDYLGGNFHLQANSLCINSANNAAVTTTTTTDLDGNPRLAGGTVDIGAYEFPSPASIISYAWLQQYGFPTDGTADFADPDGDGMNNWQEFIAGTNPTNAASFLNVTSIHPVVSQNRAVIQWQSVNTRTYYLQRSANLGDPSAFSTIQSNIVGQTGTTIFIDSTATNGGPYFYRVGVQ